MAEGRRSTSTRRGSERVREITGLLHPALPVWDLCCDHGQIGCAALAALTGTQVVFVDRARPTVERLERRLGHSQRFAGRYRVQCDDVLQMELPAAAVNFVVAGVSTNLICAFLSRLLDRRGDRIVCNTFQDASRFEERVLALGFTIDTSVDVTTPGGRQRIWVLASGDGANRG